MLSMEVICGFMLNKQVNGQKLTSSSGIENDNIFHIITQIKVFEGHSCQHVNLSMKAHLK